MRNHGSGILVFGFAVLSDGGGSRRVLGGTGAVCAGEAPCPPSDASRRKTSWRSGGAHGGRFFSKSRMIFCIDTRLGAT